MMLTTRLHLVLRLKVSGAISVLPTYVCLRGMHRNSCSLHMFQTNGTEIILIRHFSIEETVPTHGIVVAQHQSVT